jgi:hypothetical protein
VLIVLKSGSLNLLEPSGLVKACNGIALPLNLGRMEWCVVGVVGCKDNSMETWMIKWLVVINIL